MGINQTWRAIANPKIKKLLYIRFGTKIAAENREIYFALILLHMADSFYKRFCLSD